MKIDIPNPVSLKPESNKYETIQVLRFIAALMVIVLHSTFYAKDRLQPSFHLFGPGYNGVPLFSLSAGLL